MLSRPSVLKSSTYSTETLSIPKNLSPNQEKVDEIEKSSNHENSRITRKNFLHYQEPGPAKAKTLKTKKPSNLSKNKDPSKASCASIQRSHLYIFQPDEEERDWDESK